MESGGWVWRGDGYGCEQEEIGGKCDMCIWWIRWRYPNLDSWIIAYTRATQKAQTQSNANLTHNFQIHCSFVSNPHMRLCLRITGPRFRLAPLAPTLTFFQPSTQHLFPPIYRLRASRPHSKLRQNVNVSLLHSLMRFCSLPGYLWGFEPKTRGFYSEIQDAALSFHEVATWRVTQL